MQISSSQLYERSMRQMSALSARADTLQTQISTEKKLATAADDVVAYQRLRGLQQAGADDTAYTANVTIAQALLQQTDTSLGSVETQLQRAQELAIQANSDTLSDDNRKVIAGQLRAIVEDLAGIANGKDVRGQPLFGAATGDSAVSVAADGSVDFVGTGEAAAIPVGDGVSVKATEPAARVFGGIVSQAGGSATAAAGQASDDLTRALSQVGQVRGSVGARAARLDLESERMQSSATDREITRSSLEDTDISAAITELQQTMTVLSATQASFTKLSSLSLFDYLS